MDTVRCTCMTTMELVEICKTGSVIALVSRDDEENTRYAVELCECVSQDNTEDIVYFSLKTNLEEFERAYPGALKVVDDTPAISVENLENKIESRIKSSKVSMIVIDYLALMIFHNKENSRELEFEQILSKLKLLSEQKKISILILLPLSKYAPNNYSIMKELKSYYGDVISNVDFMIPVTSEMIDCRNKANLVYIGEKGCDING